ncbi:MAG: hypothetical protein ACP6IS_08580 [Candidatus Asgardarchaeia archaeon]
MVSIHSIINRAIKKQLTTAGVFAIPKTIMHVKGIVTARELDVKEIVDPKSGYSLKLGDPEKIKPTLDDFEAFIVTCLGYRLKEKSLAFSRNEVYFHEKTDFTHEEIAFKVYEGFTFDVIFYQDKLYLMITNRFKPFLYPTFDKLLSFPEFRSVSHELRGSPLNTIPEYSKQFNKPAFAGYLREIIYPSHHNYQKLLKEIISYYKRENESVYRFIEMKIDESPNQPIVLLSQKGVSKPISYLSSLLILTPGAYVIAEIVDELTRNKNLVKEILRRYFNITSSYPAEYMELSIEWLEIIRDVLQSSELFKIGHDFDYITMRGDSKWQ